ncbi:cyclopropane-fatty-acyl-phospholipid synthase family protein [Uliginosibacterium sp. H3]|uniref:Cyclopropane-fatty-acyl-phospholipid synthase family protein n=1 Tax=Uliginosibacterium silvisoli TaxID=3114758 RepID=A0ABU6K2W9_9RHOO|nr:cyclopropane-fatty-acyl-phospholipid synthase family protein [Uliginosibacterium sp. H3]
MTNDSRGVVLDDRALQRSVATPRAARLVIDMLEKIAGGAVMLELPNGSRVQLGEGERVATLVVRDWQVFERIIGKGSIGFAECWMEGLWETDHLAPLLTLMASNREVLQQAIHGNILRLALYRVWHSLRANTRKGSRKNIEAHYDLGNDFYSLWLDETMTYSSARFTAPDMPLEDAQREKYRRILQRLQPRPGQRILEVGCGWGGFAEVAATEFGCHVHGLTLSPSQLAWARKRAEQGGFADRATFELRDYRDVSGQFDHVASIEMVEAVGEKYWPTYFRKLRECVAPGGRIVIQGITIAHGLFAHYRRDVDFIQRYIFPGGMLLSPAVLGEQARQAGLRLVGEDAFGLDYARTLSDWMARFNRVRDAVMAQGFDERFVRMWQFYLAYCEAGFRAGSTDVHHFELMHAG